MSGSEIPLDLSFLGSRIIFMEQAKPQEAFGSCQTGQFWHLPVATLGNTASLYFSFLTRHTTLPNTAVALMSVKSPQKWGEATLDVDVL